MLGERKNVFPPVFGVGRKIKQWRLLGCAFSILAHFCQVMTYRWCGYAKLRGHLGLSHALSTRLCDKKQYLQFCDADSRTEGVARGREPSPENIDAGLNCLCQKKNPNINGCF